MLFSQLREGDFVTFIILMRSIQKTDESLQKKHLTFFGSTECHTWPFKNSK